MNNPAAPAVAHSAAPAVAHSAAPAVAHSAAPAVAQAGAQAGAPGGPTATARPDIVDPALAAALGAAGIGPPAGRAGSAPADRANASAPVPDRPPPALQLAPALIAIGGSGAGTHRLTVRLDPAELGQVEIRIDRPKSGPPEVRIAVERAETLSLLQRDHALLRQALDQAGIAPEGRQIEFRLLARIEPANGAAGWTPGDPGGSQNGAGGDRQAGRGPDGRPGGGAGAAADGADPPLPTGAAGALRWRRAGVNITA